MKKFTIAAATASILAGCAVNLPSQTATPTSATTATPSPPPTNASSNALPPNTILTKEVGPNTSIFGWLFPDRLKEIVVQTGRAIVGMWMFNSPDNLEAKEFTYAIAWPSKVQKLEGFEITVNNIPAFSASAPNIVYNANAQATVSDKVTLGSSTYPNRFDHIVAWATIPKGAGGTTLQVTLDVTSVKRVDTGVTKDPEVTAMAADALIILWQ